MTPAVESIPDPWKRWLRGSLVAGLVALALLVFGAFGDPAQFFRAYLAAYLFLLGLALGPMVILMIYHITGGAWGFLVRRILEAAMRTLPLLALGFIPIALGATWLFPFAQPAMQSNADIEKQRIVMNLPFFWGRAAAYFVLWLLWAWMLTSASRQQDRSGDPRLAVRMDGLSGSGLLVYGVTLHFAAIDWLMCLQPAFHSTIFGPLVASGHLLSGLAFTLVVLAALRERPPFVDFLAPKSMNDLGNLLLTFVIIWTYMNWFQYMLIWIANLPVDVIWYLARGDGGWFWLEMVVLAGSFIVPFLLLLWRSVKQHPPRLARVAVLVLVTQWLYMELQVQPPFLAGRIVDQWMDPVAVVALGGIWLAFFIWQLWRWPLMATHDFNQAEAARLRRVDEEEVAWEESLAHG